MTAAIVNVLREKPVTAPLSHATPCVWATYTKIECNELAMYTTEVNIYSVVYFVRFSRDVAGIMRG